MGDITVKASTKGGHGFAFQWLPTPFFQFGTLGIIIFLVAAWLRMEPLMYIIVIAIISLFIWGVRKHKWIFDAGKGMRDLIENLTFGSKGKPFDNAIEGEVLSSLSQSNKKQRKLKRGGSNG